MPVLSRIKCELALIHGLGSQEVGILFSHGAEFDVSFGHHRDGARVTAIVTAETVVTFLTLEEDCPLLSEAHVSRYLRLVALLAMIILIAARRV